MAKDKQRRTMLVQSAPVGNLSFSAPKKDKLRRTKLTTGPDSGPKERNIPKKDKLRRTKLTWIPPDRIAHTGAGSQGQTETYQVYTGDLCTG